MDRTEPVVLRVEDQPDGQDLQIASADPGNLKNRFSCMEKLSDQVHKYELMEKFASEVCACHVPTCHKNLRLDMLRFRKADKKGIPAQEPF